MLPARNSVFGKFGRRYATRLVLEQLEARSLLTLALDPTFTYPNGYAPGHVFVEHHGEGSSMAIQPDGKVLVGGYTVAGLNGNPDFALLRVNPDGSPDPTFNADGNGDGFVAASFFDSPYLETIQAVTTQNVNGEDRIVVAGRAVPPGASGLAHVFAVMRFLPNGTPDPSFGCPGCDGKVTIQFPHQGQGMLDGFAWDVAVQEDGKIVVGGYADFLPGGPGKRFAVARLTRDGRLDRTFGNRGKVVFAGEGGEVRGLKLLPPDPVSGKQKILVCGPDRPPPMRDFAVAQLEADGSLDTDEFASESANPYKGIRRIDFSDAVNHDDIAWDLILQEQNGQLKIVVTGESRFDPGTGDKFRDFGLTRLLPNGDLDTEFGNHQPRDGKRTFHIGYEDVGLGITLDSQGRIVIAGTSFYQTEPGTPRFFAGARFTPNADEPDAAVETFQSSFPDATGHGDQGWGVAAWGDKILAGGFHTALSGSGFGIIRLCDAPCTPAPDRAASTAAVTSVAVGGIVTWEPAWVAGGLLDRTPSETEALGLRLLEVFAPIAPGGSASSAAVKRHPQPRPRISHLIVPVLDWHGDWLDSGLLASMKST